MSDSNDDTPNSLETFITPRVISFISTEVLFEALLPFVENELKAKWDDVWNQAAFLQVYTKYPT